jgi:hypothetical protein
MGIRHGALLLMFVVTTTFGSGPNRHLAEFFVVETRAASGRAPRGVRLTHAQ